MTQNLLEQVREAGLAAKSDLQQAADLALAQAIDDAMAKLKPVLDEPQFTGDIHTALIHNMGREAFKDNETTEPYVDLAGRIEEHAGEGVTPVMLITILKNDWGEYIGTSSALVKVDGDLVFRSTEEREEGVGMHAYTNTTADVINRQLSLVGKTTTVSGNIAGPSSNIGEPKTKDSLVLRESRTADGDHGKGMPSDYAFRDVDTDILRDEASTIFIGWDEIQAALIKQISATNGLQDALKLQKFFETSDDLEDLVKNAPQLAEVIKNATAFQSTLGKVAAK